jgi:hypothetical protein
MNPRVARIISDAFIGIQAANSVLRNHTVLFGYRDTFMSA